MAQEFQGVTCENQQNQTTGVENTRKNAGRPAGKSGRKSRIKPRHLSLVVKALIVDTFQVVKSTEDIAEQFGIPARTVADVILLAALSRGVQRQQGAVSIRTEVA